MKCYVCGSGSMTYAPANPVAWLRLRPSGNIVRLCQTDLDLWLDDADAGSTNEPSGMGWLR